MPSVSDVFSIAQAEHRAGRLGEAERLYRQVLAVEPNRAEAWHLLSEIAFHTGRFEGAAECIVQGIRICPDDADAHCSLGLALQKQGKIEEAIASYQRALQLQPQDAVTENNLGSAFKQRGELAVAVECYRRAIGINPTLSEAHNNLGTALARQGLFADAIRAFDQALELKSSDPQILSNLSEALRRDGQILQAIERCREALAIAPLCVSAHVNLGIALRDVGRLAEGNACFRRALELDPQHPKSHFSLASSLLLTGDFAGGWREYEWRWRTDEAPERFFRQPRWNGEAVEGKTVLVWAEQGLGDTIQFMRYLRMVKERGARVVFECQRALGKLLSAALENPRTKEPKNQISEAPKNQVRAWSADARPALDIDQLVVEGEPLPGFDFQAPLLSLPLVFGTRLETIPAEAPYLWADEALNKEWKAKLDALPCFAAQNTATRTFRIGVNWHGRAGIWESKRRDVPVEMFQKLAGVPGVRMVSLQKEESKVQGPKSRVEEGEFQVSSSTFQVGAAGGGRLAIVDLGEIDAERGAFMDTAAIMMNLDLVITSDTSIAHLAGALGVPVWVALPLVPDWRWLLDRSDSPWYPTMRLFRQKGIGDWEGVFGEIEEALRERMRDKR